MASTRLPRLLAIISALIAAGQWIVFVPLLAMGTVNSDSTYDALVLAAFFGWPLAAVAAFAAAALVERRPRAAAALLVFVVAALIYPFFIGGIIALAAAVLAFRSRPSEAEARPGGWLKVKDVSRALVIGLIALFAVVVLVPSLVSVIIFVRSRDDGASSAAEPAQGPFTDPDQALQDYAESRWPPFQGECVGFATKGSCVDSSDRSDSSATYRLCTVDHVECATLHITRKADLWAVTEVEEPSPVPKQ